MALLRHNPHTNEPTIMVITSETKPLRLTVSNFGPIAEGAIELRPMTVFVGPSNTGKSYLAILVYALHQFFGSWSGFVLKRGASTRSLVRPPPMVLPVSNMSLSATDVDAIYKWAETELVRIESARQAGTLPFESFLPKEVSALVRRALGEVGSLSSDLDNEIGRCFGVDKAARLVSYLADDPVERFMGSTVANRFGDGEADAYRYEMRVYQRGTNIIPSLPNVVPFGISESLDFPWFRLSPDDVGDRREDNARIHLAVFAAMALALSVGPLGRPAHYLPADRAGVMHSHQVAVRGLIAGASRVALRPESPMPMLSGVLGDFLDQLVALAQVAPSHGHETHEALALRLEHLVDGEIRVERSQLIDYPSFYYRPGGWERDLPLMNASSMVSELAPVVLYLRHVVQRGDTLIIEEPESHLHPQAQVEFTRLLAAAVKAGIRIIITTHSEWVLEELANLVRLSELPEDRREGIEAADCALSPDEIGAWFFDPNGESGGSVVREIPLDVDSGTFPSGFGLVTEDLYNRWVEITSRVENG